MKLFPPPISHETFAAWQALNEFERIQKERQHERVRTEKERQEAEELAASVQRAYGHTTQRLEQAKARLLPLYAYQLASDIMHQIRERLEWLAIEGIMQNDSYLYFELAVSEGKFLEKHKLVDRFKNAVNRYLRHTNTSATLNYNIDKGLYVIQLTEIAD